MKFLWVILFALLVHSTSVFAVQTCESLFDSSGLSPALIKKIDAKSLQDFRTQFSAVSLEAPIPDKARKIGYELFRISTYFSGYLGHLESKNIQVNKSEILGLGDLLNAKAREFLKETNLQYKIRRVEVLGTTKNAYVILPVGKHPLNKEAKKLLENSGTELIYSPYELLESNSSALYSPSLNSITISHTILVEGSVYNNESGKHELLHLYVKILYDQNKPYLFHGYAETSGTLPGGKGPYSKRVDFDEPDAFITQAYANIENLTKIDFTDTRFTEQEHLNMAGIYKASLKISLHSGYRTTVQSLNIFREALKNLEQDPDSITFVKKGNYHHATWKIKKENNKDSYESDIPLLTTGNPSRAELLQQLKDHLYLKQFKMMYYRNLLKVGLDLFERIDSLRNSKFTPEFVKYQNILKRNYEYNRYKDVPNQKFIQNSANFEF